jgi:hypothetical protein
LLGLESWHIAFWKHDTNILWLSYNPLTLGLACIEAIYLTSSHANHVISFLSSPHPCGFFFQWISILCWHPQNTNNMEKSLFLVICQHIWGYRFNVCTSNLLHPQMWPYLAILDIFSNCHYILSAKNCFQDVFTKIFFHNALHPIYVWLTNPTSK